MLKLSPASAPAGDDPAAQKAETARAREESRRLAMEREPLLRQGAAVSFAFIDEHRGDFPV